MLLRLLLLFTLVPLVELVLLIWVTQHTNLAFTIALVLVTGVIGAALARHEGLRCWRKAQEEMAAGRLPGDPLIDALLILIAGALLITPGILTDLVGFALLTPPVRRILRTWLKRSFQARIQIIPPMHDWPPSGPPERDEIIDTRIIDVPPEDEEV